MIWNETKECMSRDEMTALQSKRLIKLVDYVYHNVEFYRKKMQALGLLPLSHGRSAYRCLLLRIVGHNKGHLF